MPALLLPLSLVLLAGTRDLSGREAAPSGRLPRFDVQGHRGARGLVPENTLPAFERAIARLIEQNGLVGRVTIQSFDHRSTLRVHQLNPAIETVVLTSTGNPVRPDLLAKDARVAGWSPTFRFLDRDLVERAHRGGVRVIPWTVNDEPSMRALIQMGVDGIITDVPDVLITLLQREFPGLRRGRRTRPHPCRTAPHQASDVAGLRRAQLLLAEEAG